MVSCVRTLNDNQAKEYNLPLLAKIKKYVKKKKAQRGTFTSLLDIKHREDGGSRGASAIRAEAAGVTLKPLPLRRSAGRSRRSGCLSASSEGLNQVGEAVGRRW